MSDFAYAQIPAAPADTTPAYSPSTMFVKLYSLNSPARDNTPVVSADGRVMYFNSTRRGGPGRTWAKYDPMRGRYDDDIYFSTRPAYGGDWSDPVNLGPAINTSGDDAVVALGLDGHTVYFSSLKPGWEKDGGPFYKAELYGTAWSKMRGLGGGITQFFGRHNRERFRVYGGSVSPDGRQFYFATTAHSYSGNQEIWVSHLEPWGGWSDPDNLGPVINNGDDNFAPFIAADGVTLYFASRRSGGFGGDDLWMSVLKEGNWSEPRNLGPTVNTASDESFASLDATGILAYFSRTEADPDDDDIYMVELPPELRPAGMMVLHGRVTDSAGRPVAAEVTIQKTATGQVMNRVKNNPITGEYSATLQPGTDYTVTARQIENPDAPAKMDYCTVPSNEDEPDVDHDFTVGHPEAEPPLPPAPQPPIPSAPSEPPALGNAGGAAEQEGPPHRSYVMRNVYFQTGATMLTLRAQRSLRHLVDILQKDSTLHIEVGGHTDDVGLYDNNMRLSELRAEAVKAYLINQGVDPHQVQSKGYGSDRPLVSNTTRAGRRKNRRTEFTILE